MYLQNLIEEVNKTHSGLGELVAICQLATVAHKCVLIVSPSGCGKSRAMYYVANNYSDNVLKRDKTSSAGLGKDAKYLTDSDKLIVVDDLSNSGTIYARTATMVTLAALCYTHEMHSGMGGEDGHYEIENFYGSALIGIQPKLLKELLVCPEWETTIRDKVMRYYHLKRPVLPNLKFPTFNLSKIQCAKEEFDFEPDEKNIHWQKMHTLAQMQFSVARSKEHLIDLLKACATLDNRKKVIYDDYEILEVLLRPMALELLSTNKEELEGEQQLDSNLLSLLTEYYTYCGQFSLTQVQVDYKIKARFAYQILQNQKIYWEQISKEPILYKPTKKFEALLKKYNLVI